MRWPWQRKAKPLASDWLELKTGHDAAWWMLVVQGLIAEEWRENPDDPDHPLSEPAVWMEQLIVAVNRCRPPEDGEPYDENLWMASVVGSILAVWAARCSYAKTHDPNRPVGLRRLAYLKHQQFTAGLSMMVHSIRRDTDVWADQQWEQPFQRDATDGSFV